MKKSGWAAAMAAYILFPAAALTEALETTAADDTATILPAEAPAAESAFMPTKTPATAPTAAPTVEPTKAPTAAPTAEPTKAPTAAPTEEPTKAPTAAPTAEPTKAPTPVPTAEPTKAPTTAPTQAPTAEPVAEPTDDPEVPAELTSLPVQSLAGNELLTVSPQPDVFTARFNEKGDRGILGVLLVLLLTATILCARQIGRVNARIRSISWNPDEEETTVDPGTYGNEGR